MSDNELTPQPRATMCYEIFRHKYAAWLRLTPKVHTLSPVDPLKRCYAELGQDIHSLPREILENYLESYYLELHDGSVA